MISELTVVKVVDNSGALKGKCIKILSPKSSKGRGRKAGKVGSIILITILETTPGSKIKPGDLWKALVVRTKKGSKYLRVNKDKKSAIEFRRLMGLKTPTNGHTTSYDDNCVTLIKFVGRDIVPVASRIKAPIDDTLIADEEYEKLIAVVG